MGQIVVCLIIYVNSLRVLEKEHYTRSIKSDNLISSYPSLVPLGVERLISAWNYFSRIVSTGDNMHLFETEDGDIWVCVNCGRDHEEEIKNKDWEYIFDRDDPELRCKLCGGPDFEVEG